MWVGVSASVLLGRRLQGSHSTVTHGLMGKENILNLSYPSETVTCGFQKHEFPEEGEGKRGESVDRVWKVGEVGSRPT